MLLNFHGHWYEIHSHIKCEVPGFVHHESGKMVVRPDVLKKLKDIRGDTEEMKKIFNRLTQVKTPEQLNLT